MNDLGSTEPQARGRVLVLLHVACEPPAEYSTVLEERGIPTHTVLLGDGVELPDWRDFVGIIAMGGPMSANDDDKLPWITAEKKLIHDAVSAGTPYWGVCLGAQLLAAAMGGRVYAGEVPEIGMTDVQLVAAAAEDPVFAGVPLAFSAFQWHGDTFELPPNATWLATNEAYRHQAFVVGAGYGVQFHVEVGNDLAEQWMEIPEYAAGLEKVHGDGAGPKLLADLAAEQVNTRTVARTLFENWLDHRVVPFAESTSQN